MALPKLCCVCASARKGAQSNSLDRSHFCNHPISGLVSKHTAAPCVVVALAVTKRKERRAKWCLMAPVLLAIRVSVEHTVSAFERHLPMLRAFVWKAW